MPVLAGMLSNYPCSDHAFVHGKNCVTNAQAHLGKQYVLSMDIEDFFDSINPDLLRRYLTNKFIHLVTEDEAPRQGLPTSPVVCNLAMIEADAQIRSFCEEMGGVSYTRYADDLTFSFNDRALHRRAFVEVSEILMNFGLSVNKAKTRLQNIRNGAVHVTGIAITSEGIRPTRSTLRRLRAAIHQDNQAQASGLKEWSKCKFPKNCGVINDSMPSASVFRDAIAQRQNICSIVG